MQDLHTTEWVSLHEALYFTEMCSGSEAGLCVRLMDFRITQLQA